MKKAQSVTRKPTSKDGKERPTSAITSKSEKRATPGMGYPTADFMGLLATDNFMNKLMEKVDMEVTMIELEPQ
jgi:hypothetical protein